MRMVPAFVLAACVTQQGSSSSTDPAKIVMKVETIATDGVDSHDAAQGVAPRRGAIRFVKPTLLLKEPRRDAAKVGAIRKGAVAMVVETAPAGEGCRARWIRIAPRGWACETAVVATTAVPPNAAAAVSLDEPDDPDAKLLVPGVYGIVRGTDVQAYDTRDDVLAGDGRALEGSHSVRAAGVVTIDGVRYWRTSQGALIDASAIVTISPSRFKGVAIDGELPAWVRAKGDPYKPEKTRSAPDAHAPVIGELAARTVVSILEEQAGFARIDDTQWIARADLRVATLAAPPSAAGLTEKWFDIDLDEQVLVAYEGARPVYATLVSTGKWRHETPPGIARIASKHERAHMVSEKDDERYSVADVPWTMYYDHNFALHTSYWHDGFGGPRSHGCVNLAPRDARLLFRWSSPDVPPGWTAVYGDEDTPGSLVRVRSRRVPEPDYRGYARAMEERGVVVSSVTPSG